jgi:hypothetical protein
MFFPGKCHQHAHPCVSASVEKPSRRRMINAHNIQSGLSHEREIDIHLLGPTEIVPFGVRLEGTVRDAFDEKLFVTFQKEFRRRANSRVCPHSESSLSPCTALTQRFYRRGSHVGCCKGRFQPTRLPLQLRECFVQHTACALQIFWQVRRGYEPGFKLRWREGDAAP